MRVTGTSCGRPSTPKGDGGRAKAIAVEGNRVTFLWPCGYQRTEVMRHKVLRKPMTDSEVAFLARYWADGVTYPCPKCSKKQEAK
jgi:hypothetical protein